MFNIKTDAGKSPNHLQISALLISLLIAATPTFARQPTQKDKAAHNIDGGFTYLLRDNIMIDISGGIGLTNNAPNYYTAIGFSFRLKD